MYILGKGSRRELQGVHPNLIRLVERVIEITEQDFTVHDGLRTREEQIEYIHRGVSRTMKSKHLPQEDGYSHAVDLVPYINGRLRWEWDPIYRIAEAMRQAANEFDVPIRWGGCWQTINGTTVDPEVLVAEYVTRKQHRGKKVFIDGPHFELT